MSLEFHGLIFASEHGWPKLTKLKLPFLRRSAVKVENENWNTRQCSIKKIILLPWCISCYPWSYFSDLRWFFFGFPLALKSPQISDEILKSNFITELTKN